MKILLNILIVFLLASTLLTTGCARKSIQTDPTAQTPGKHKTVKKKSSGLIEKTVDVESDTQQLPKDSQELAKLEEHDLIEQDLGPFKPSDKGLVYIQVGAFSDHQGAQKALSGLMIDGYKGSRFAEDENDGFYRVQAGVFPDRECAERALKKLKMEYPDSFILIEKPKKETK